MDEKDLNGINNEGGSEEEKLTDTPTGGADIAVKQPFKAKLENFWYHYKWHSIVALFIVIVVTICTLQMCKRTSYDIHIIYAGDHEIRKTSSGSTSPYEDILLSLSNVVDDFDGDGEVNINLLNLFVINEQEKEELLGKNEGLTINESLVREDTKTLEQTLVYGEHYICFLSERIFREYDSEFEGAIFASLEPYADKSKSYEYANDRKTGIYLRSLAISRLPELSNLPDDTVVCIRTLNPVSQKFGKKQNEENFRRAEIVIKNILRYD